MHTRDIFNLDPSKWANQTYSCDCERREHALTLGRIQLEAGAINRLAEIAAPFAGKAALVVCDQNTFSAAGEAVLEQLQLAGVKARVHRFETGEKALVPDERALGSVLMALEDDTALLIALGSGTLGDITRFVGAKSALPYIAVAAAASMDGYASNNSPLIQNGRKITLYTSSTAHAIIADTDIFAKAPISLTQAGYGDVIGKLTAKADWLLAEKLNGEYRCPQIAALVEEALSRCFQTEAGIRGKSPSAAFDTMYALLFTGVAMSMLGISRPASGAEHHFSHYWEMDAIAKGQEHPLHGHMVGAATPVVSAIYELLDMKSREGVAAMPSKEIQAHLRAAGCADGPKALGIPLPLFKESVIHALEVRNRYSVLQYAKDRDLLEGLVGPLVERFY